MDSGRQRALPGYPDRSHLGGCDDATPPVGRDDYLSCVIPFGAVPDAPTGLPVLQGPAADSSPRWLADLCVDVQLDDPARLATWVHVAQESTHATRNVSAVAMGLLDAVGRASAQLLRVLLVDLRDREASLAERQAALRSVVRDRALAQTLSLDAPGPPRAAPTQLYRVLGVLACWRLDDEVLRLLERTPAERRPTMSPQAHVASRFDHLRPEFVLLRGPTVDEHLVEVRTSDGLAARGRGRTVSDAHDAAAQAWLHQRTARAGRKVLSLAEADTVRIASERLALSAGGQAQLEEAIRLGEAQQDSALSRLMHLGRAYADHLFAREIALDALWQTLDPRPSVTKALRVGDRTLAIAALGDAAEAMMIPIAIAAIGVAAREQGPGSDSLEADSSPLEVWVASRAREVSQRRQSEEDELSAFVLAAGGSLSWLDVEDDDGSHRSQLRVESVASGAACKVIASAPQPTAAGARNTTAELFLRLAQASCRPESFPPTDTLTRRVFDFWLRHLLASGPSTTRERHRWRQRGLAGIDLVAEPEELRTWLRSVDDLLGEVTDEARVVRFAAYFHEATDVLGRQHRAAFTAELELVLDWVEQKAADGDYVFKGTDEWDVLNSLLIVERVASAGDETRVLATEVENWLDLQKDISPRPSITFEAQRVNVSELTAQAVFGLLDVAESAARKVHCDRPRMEVRAVRDGGYVSLRVDGNGATAWSRLVDDDPVVACLNELDAAVRVDVQPQDVRIYVDAADKPSGSLARAVLASRRDLGAELTGRLLHDLKNLLVASELAAASAALTDRTTGLQTALAAQQHLDEAGLVVDRLRASAGMVGGSTETVDVVPFVRAYAADALTSLPPSVGLTWTGSTSRAVLVETSPAILRACLANLVLNACEAMPDGGQLTLGVQAVASGDVARIQVTDTGPGVPAHVLTALQSNGMVNSTKAGGSGLGLVSVRQSLMRVGGVLIPEPRAGGHTWWIELPTTESETSNG